jgi:transposase InsO family protein
MGRLWWLLSPSAAGSFRVASRGVKRTNLRRRERGLLVLCARLLPGWRRALLLVKPETVLRWHREGFRRFWRRKSRSTAPREPRLAPDLVALIERMTAENRLVDLNAKRVVHVAATHAPTQLWTAQQLRNATPFGQGPKFIIRDRDDQFGSVFDRVAMGAGIRVLRTAILAPLMNSVCERFLGSVRRECLDHVMVLREAHLQKVLADYALSYFNTARPHQGTGQQIPVSGEHLQTQFTGSVTAIPVLGGPHHDYRIRPVDPTLPKIA